MARVLLRLNETERAVLAPVIAGAMRSLRKQKDSFPTDREKNGAAVMHAVLTGILFKLAPSAVREEMEKGGDTDVVSEVTTTNEGNVN